MKKSSNKQLSNLILLVSIYMLIPLKGWACDLCSIYNSIESHKNKAGTFSVSVAEQYTNFNEVQFEGNHVDNVADQHMESSVTQVLGAYDVTDEFALQVNLPFISRHFKRLQDEQTEYGDEEGLGDASLIAKYTPYRYKSAESTFSLQVFAGLKFPTGDSDRLAEEQNEHHDEELDSEEHENSHEDVEHQTHESSLMRHGGSHGETPSAIHGHDLALGSGSYDFPVGAQFFAQYEKFLLTGNIQYIFRTEGDFSYRYANDLLYSAGPKYYLASKHEYAVAAGFNLSGETKGKDSGENGATQDDTGISSLFIGPSALATVGDDLTAEIGWDLPVYINNTAYQIVPDYKIKAAVSYRF